MRDEDAWVQFAAALVVLEKRGQTWQEVLDNVIRSADYMLHRYRERFPEDEQDDADPGREGET